MYEIYAEFACLIHHIKELINIFACRCELLKCILKNGMIKFSNFLFTYPYTADELNADKYLTVEFVTEDNYLVFHNFLAIYINW